MTSLAIKFAGLTHVGIRRVENQDSYLLAPDLNLFIVADGMGGHKGGQTASMMAVQTIRDFVAAERGKATEPKMKAADLVQKAILVANEAIQTRGQSDMALQGMGTTTSLIYFDQNTLCIGHVGDSRIYLAHPRRIWQLTRDHSLVQEKLRAGLITREDLKTDRMKNVITRSVGFEKEVDVDIYTMEAHTGDVFILCSDGLSGMIDDSDILAITDECVFRRGAPQMAAERLIEAANQNGGEDNVTVVVVQIEAVNEGQEA